MKSHETARFSRRFLFCIKVTPLSIEYSDPILAIEDRAGQ
jgi:hypothetical protein